MNYVIRPIKESEYYVLKDFLYEAIFIPKGIEKPSKKIIEKPELSIYIDDFGKSDDYCLVAELNGKIIGAIWTRIMNDYGHIDDKTPSLSISIYPQFRKKGIGTQLIKSILKDLKQKGYKKVSLSVQKKNYAHKLYLKLGFNIVIENNEEYIMICNL